MYRILTAFYLLIASHTVWADPDAVVAKVIEVESGDTLVIKDQHGTRITVQLDGIDAPELDQEYGLDALANLMKLTLYKRVEVNLPDCKGNSVCQGRVSIDGEDVSLIQLTHGYAWAADSYTRRLPDIEYENYRLTERIAQASHLGIWRNRRPTPPWVHRHLTRASLLL